MTGSGIMQSFDLTGRRALVTGGVRSLGFEMARGLGEAGAHVVVNSRGADAVDEAVSRLQGLGVGADGVALDLTDDAAVNAWFAEDGGDFDILVNNIGMRDRRGTADLPPDAFARLLDFGVTTAYRLTRLVAPGMAAKGRGAVINITSIAGPMARVGDPGYTAAKGALDALTRSQAVELGPMGIRVNAVAPGFFDTEANATAVADPTFDGYVKSRVPLGRWGRPPELAGAVVFLASDAASYVNGHTLTVDGGHLVKL